MDWGWVAAVTGFALAMAGTPGPNNMLVTASGANHGFRRTLPLASGIAFGVAGIILVVGAFGTSLVADPQVRVVLKWAGLAYLLWLAWRIVSARPAKGAKEGEAGRPLTFLQGALFQLVNPKLWAMVAGAVVTYGGTAAGEDPLAIALVFMVVFGTAALASTLLWTWVGVAAGRFLESERSLRLFNWAMAALLVLSLVPVLAE
ncbi:MAG: LysE family translocator [Tistlia sp.]|uniref:LysE family translocator n=1 Tax=Tistlia sp. TaxID=3057121 RepID=UPI0034A21F68